jgi:hypothetical protein
MGRRIGRTVEFDPPPMRIRPATDGARKKSEMRGFSVAERKALCGFRDGEGLPANRGALAPADVRPFDAN